MYVLKSGLRFSFRALEVPKPQVKMTFSSLSVWVTGESFSYEQTPLIPDFELLDSESTHYHLPISKKIHRDKFNESQSVFLPLVPLHSINMKTSKKHQE